ncbi:transposase [Streptomyces yanii]|uniref:Transposase n=1 Tax=Streptomyces yanii TaxID=78510 RepID=A0ABV5R7H8_9ACTN
MTSGCAWRHLPPTFGTSPATAHRRFTVWTEAGLWRRLHRAVLDELGARGEVDWTSAIVDAASVRAKKGGIADRAEPGRSRSCFGTARMSPYAKVIDLASGTLRNRARLTLRDRIVG